MLNLRIHRVDRQVCNRRAVTVLFQTDSIVSKQCYKSALFRSKSIPARRAVVDSKSNGCQRQGF